MGQKNRVGSLSFTILHYKTNWEEEEYVFLCFFPLRYCTVSGLKTEMRMSAMTDKLEVAVRWSLSQTGRATAQ